MNAIPTEEHIEAEFHVSWYIIAYKFLFGLTEFLFGTGITLFGKNALTWYRIYAARELSEDPHDLIVHLTRSLVPNILTHHTFLAFYLLVLGGAKIAGAIGLMRHENWGVDLLVALTLIMFPFQFVRLLMHPSVADFFYIFTGIGIALYLINFRPHEWAARMATKLKRKRSV